LNARWERREDGIEIIVDDFWHRVSLPPSLSRD
jgi:hypothetical protein